VSYQGQTWVDEIALPHLKNTGELVMMLRVANHAGNGPKKMSGCFAGSKTLAAECLMSPRAAQTHLRELTRRGLLVPGDPKLVNHVRPDHRPPVYDLAGAHEPGCPGGHDIDGDCLPSPAGGKNCYPWQEEESRRSAGSKNCHPSADRPATGSKKRPARVAKSATKSSKELKESSLFPEAPPSPDAPAPSAEPGREREPAAQNELHGDAGQVLAAYEQALGGPALNGTRARLLRAASELLETRPLWWVIDRARELPKYGTNLVQHAEMSKAPITRAAIPAARKSCPLDQCDGGGIVYRDPELMLGPSRCACRTQHVPA
jgi:hypothetical protein